MVFIAVPALNLMRECVQQLQLNAVIFKLHDNASHHLIMLFLQGFPILLLDLLHLAIQFHNLLIQRIKLF